MTEAFTENRAVLFGIAYRMLGRVADAEDVVQETFLRWQKQDITKIDSAKAWLISTATRLSIDQLRSARRQRESYVGVWLPEPLLTAEGADIASPADHAALADSLSLAFMTMLEELSPTERAVFLLREAFDYDYPEIARIVGKSEANCRQMISRAKGRLRQRERTENVSPEKAKPIVRRFLDACATGNVEELLSVLTDDVVLYTDGGGRVKSALRPIRSADHVARFYAGIRKRSTDAASGLVRVNGELGAIVRRGDGTITLSAFAFENGRIKAIYSVRNPEKLKHLPPLDLPN